MNSAIKALHHHRIGQAKGPKKPVPGTGQLTYYIFEGALTGLIDDSEIFVLAWSGGAGGSRKLEPTEDGNNPYSYAVKEIDNPKNPRRGGPIPPGSYQIYPPTKDKHLGLCAKLHPLFTPPNGRGGFAIHGQGPKGSDGCIVLPDAKFNDVMTKLKKSGGGHLQVCEAMEDSAFA
jgi:hypothetical protein